MPVASSHRFPPNSILASVSVPVVRSFKYRVSPGSYLLNSLVSSPLGTLILKNSK